MKYFRPLSALAALCLLLGTLSLGVAADARPGGGMSMGSRGSRTYSLPAPTRTTPYGASPMTRSFTPQSPAASPYGAPYRRPFGGSPLAAGLLGGFLGAGLGGMLLGHGFFGGGLGLGGLLGLILQLVIIVMLVRWVMRRFAGAGRGFVGASASQRAMPGRAMPMSGWQGGAGQGSAGQGGAGQGGGLRGAAGARPAPAITAADYGQFEQTLRDIQAAWTRVDTATLGRLATREMVAYFNEQLQDLSRRGLHNAVSDVRLERGDLAEAWSEGGRDYATVAMRFSMIDVTTDRAGRVVDGSPDERVSVAEYWTFVRAPGSNWLLSAIQQGR